MCIDPGLQRGEPLRRVAHQRGIHLRLRDKVWGTDELFIPEAERERMWREFARLPGAVDGAISAQLSFFAGSRPRWWCKS
ncbi:hypothetical protein AB0M79_29980 [Polymorphospora sp. NPDC051019]|uniref:hypothetical protein n=1 Tax=Polymorphospora sp. NPDC051019 TaxID=3155725 RepID=UPI0034370E27